MCIHLPPLRYFHNKTRYPVDIYVFFVNILISESENQHAFTQNHLYVIMPCTNFVTSSGCIFNVTDDKKVQF
jgi:hypothetical protein